MTTSFQKGQTVIGRVYQQKIQWSQQEKCFATGDQINGKSVAVKTHVYVINYYVLSCHKFCFQSWKPWTIDYGLGNEVSP